MMISETDSVSRGKYDTTDLDEIDGELALPIDRSRYAYSEETSARASGHVWA